MKGWTFSFNSFAELNFEFPLFRCSLRCLLHKFRVDNVKFLMFRACEGENMEWIADNEISLIFIGSGNYEKLYFADEKFTDTEQHRRKSEESKKVKLSIFRQSTWLDTIMTRTFFVIFFPKKNCSASLNILVKQSKDFKTRKTMWKIVDFSQPIDLQKTRQISNISFLCFRVRWWWCELKRNFKFSEFSWVNKWQFDFSTRISSGMKSSEWLK